jgi:aromatic-L-amino-acid/L-tryptophan decarboxylase
MTEESLDPEDWTSFRALGHRMLDDTFDRVEAIRERPVWQPIPERSRLALQTTLPRGAQSPEQAYQVFLEHVAPYPLGNDHPRFWEYRSDGSLCSFYPSRLISIQISVTP